METQAAVEEAELKDVELERQRVHLQHQLARYQEEVREGREGESVSTVLCWMSDAGSARDGGGG